MRNIVLPLNKTNNPWFPGENAVGVTDCESDNYSQSSNGQMF